LYLYKGSNVKIISSIASIDNCTFNNTSFVAEQHGILINSNPPLGSFTKVTNSIFDGNGVSTAISIDNSTNFEISNNSINGYYSNGIWVSSSGTSLSEGYKSMIYDNVIYGCGNGVAISNTKVDFKGNEIYENGVGVQLYNNSNTAFYNKWDNHQIIRDNDSFELYASHTSFPTIFRWNQIIDEDNLGNSSEDPLIYWDIENKVLKRDVTYNYWGKNFKPEEDLYPFKEFIWDPVWEPKLIKSFTPEADEILYESGITHFSEGNYTAAEDEFKNLIENHPNSPFAKAALHELFAIKKVTDYDFESLHDYFSTFTPADSSLWGLADFLATRCNVMVKEWQPAVGWYENRIVNPPSYQDSVFAVIDLGEIHLMIAADTLNNNGGPSSVKGYRPQIIARLKEIIPESKEAFEQNRAKLLATLPKTDNTKTQQPPLTERGNKKGILRHSIPNPATESTTVTYELYKEGSVEIKVYNVLGQPVLDLPQGAKQKGIYNVVISLEGLSTGLYHYVMFVDGLKVDAKKLVVE